MKKVILSLLAVGALSGLALESVSWNGFWDTTAYVNPTPVEATATSTTAVNLWYLSVAPSDAPVSFSTFPFGSVLILR